MLSLFPPATCLECGIQLVRGNVFAPSKFSVGFLEAAHLVGIGQDIEGFVQRFEILDRHHHDRRTSVTSDRHAFVCVVHPRDHLGQVIANIAER